MFNRDYLERLVRAAERAAAKMKREYDSAQPDAAPDECWAECEELLDALRPFAEVARDA
jgi:hypothetical protein